MLYRVHLAWAGFEFTTLMVIGTDYISSCKLITIRSWPRRSLDHLQDTSLVYTIVFFFPLYNNKSWSYTRAGWGHLDDVIHIVVLDEDMLMMWCILSCWMRTCWWCDAYCRAGWGHVDDVMHIVVPLHIHLCTHIETTL